jgi:hypothetical protein
MEVEFYAPCHDPMSGRGFSLSGSEPILSVSEGNHPNIYAWLDLVLTNHRTNRPEKIINVTLHLKKRRWLLWSKTIAQTPLFKVFRTDTLSKMPIQIDLSPMGREVVTVTGEGPINVPVDQLPESMELVVEFKMIGPIRRMDRFVRKVVRHQSALSTNV